jgi:hypothetical protein
MDLEERTIESLPNECENCGATLTAGEKQRILDEGATAGLCTTYAAEHVPLADVEEDEAGTGY